MYQLDSKIMSIIQNDYYKVWDFLKIKFILKYFLNKLIVKNKNDKN